MVESDDDIILNLFWAKNIRNLKKQKIIHVFGEIIQLQFIIYFWIFNFLEFYPFDQLVEFALRGKFFDYARRKHFDHSAFVTDRRFECRQGRARNGARCSRQYRRRHPRRIIRSWLLPQLGIFAVTTVILG